MTPRLSVALCTFQGARHLPEQLESLLAQTRPPDEVVVGDDGSTDETVELLERFANAAPFAVEIETHDRLGANANFAATIARCRGDLVALCDQDDRWHPDRLRAGEAVLAAEPAALLSFGDAHLIDGPSRRLGTSLWTSLGVTGPLLDALRADPLPVLLRRPVVTGCTVTFRRELMEVAAPIPVDPGMQHDRWLALCAAAEGPLVPIDARLVDYRVHGAQHTGLGPLSTSRGRPRGRFHPSRWSGLRRTDDGRLAPALTQVELLAQRLPADGHEAAREVLAEAQRLLDHRAGLPRSRIRRVGPVARELRTGRYRRFSTGWVGAAADLLRP